MPQLSQELVNVCAGLVYSEWAKAYDNRKAVQAETDDGSEDWADFHNERLRRAVKAEAEAKRWLSEITPLHTIGK